MVVYIAIVVLYNCHGTPPWHLAHAHLFSTAICRSLPQSIISAKPQNSTNFYCKDNSIPNLSTYSTTPILYLFRAYSLNNQVNNINPSLLSLTFFPYITSWLYHAVYIYSLIISTLLHIIITHTHSVTLYCVNYPHHCQKMQNEPEAPMSAADILAVLREQIISL